MEYNQTFQGGLHTDNSLLLQPENTYRSALNMVLQQDGTLRQMRAGEQQYQLPYPLLGSTMLGNEEVVFCGDGVHGAIVTLGDEAVIIMDSEQLHFPENGYVSAVGRIDYKGHRVVYFTDGVNPLRYLDLDEPASNLPDGLALLTTPSLPVTEALAVEDGGSLPSGIVQFGARQLTASKNAGTFGLLTNPVFLVNEQETATRSQYDGAPAQTSTGKSVSVRIQNLDPSYSYVEPIVATYEGSSNQLRLYTLPLISTLGKEAVSFTYYSAEQQQGEITLEELLSEYADVQSAQVLEQKDGYLLSAGLTAPSREGEDNLWQQIANSIELGPDITQVAVTENIAISHYSQDNNTGGTDTGIDGTDRQDYKNPLTAANKRGFQRGEVYSFCFTPIINNQPGNAYHIPAKDGQYTFGVYSSAELYPSGYGYPDEAGEGTTPIRHHRMPSLTEAPLVTLTQNGYVLRLLGAQEVVKPDFSVLPESLFNQVTGYIIGVQARTAGNRSILAQGIAQPLLKSGNQYTVTPFTGMSPYHNGSSTVSNSLAAFYSPETVILQEAIQQATSIEPVATLSGVTFGVADERSGDRGDKYAHVFINWQGVTPVTQTATPLSLAQYVTATAAGGFVEAGEDAPLNMTEQNGYVLLKTATSSSFPAYMQSGFPDLYYKENNDTDELKFRKANGDQLDQDDAGYTGVSFRYLYNLKTTLPRQYGAITQATYYPVAQGKRDTPDYLHFFGGDTFVGKVAIQSQATERQNDGGLGLRFRTMNYFVCESQVNVNLRHYQTALSGGVNTASYYPKQRKLWQVDGTGAMQVPSELGHPSGYNSQYSIPNRLQPLFPADTTITRVENFPNRIAYSALSVEGEQLDAYRILLPNNYHDISREHGKITDLFTLAGSLYAHTEQALWKAFMNEATTQTTSAGEVYLGNGGLFPRPSQPLVAVSGGYAGCQHPRTGVTTPQGRYFADALRGKVFQFSGQLEEISNKGLEQYFREELPGKDLFAGYDPQQQLYWLSGITNGSVLYAARHKAWCSWQNEDYTGAIASSKRLLLSAQDGSLYAPDKASVLSSTFRGVLAPIPDTQKVFDNLFLTYQNLPGSLFLTTEGQESEQLVLVAKTEYGQDAADGQLLAKQANGSWQVAVPRATDGEQRLQGRYLEYYFSFPGDTLAPTPNILYLTTLSYRGKYR